MTGAVFFACHHAHCTFAQEVHSRCLRAFVVLGPLRNHTRRARIQQGFGELDQRSVVMIIVITIHAALVCDGPVAITGHFRGDFLDFVIRELVPFFQFQHRFSAGVRRCHGSPTRRSRSTVFFSLMSTESDQRAVVSCVNSNPGQKQYCHPNTKSAPPCFWISCVCMFETLHLS